MDVAEPGILAQWPFFLPNAERVAKDIYLKVLPEVVTKADEVRRKNEKMVKDYPKLKKALGGGEIKELLKKIEELNKRPAGGAGAPPSADNV